MKNFTQKIIGIFALVFGMGFSLNAQEIGDFFEGGYIFQINEDGTGLVADIQDLGQISWNDAMDIAASATSQGYEDWYLPSIQELALIYSTIGNGSPDGNIGDFMYNWYWSSTEGSPESEPLHWLPYSETAWGVDFASGTQSLGGKAGGTLTVRVIRAVTFEVDVLGCTDSSAYNYNIEATIEDESCTYSPVILVILDPIELTNGEISPLVSSQDLWDFGVIYDSDNSLEELTITLSVNPDEINLVWDGGINTNPTVSAVSDFSGSTEIELCISDAISSVCASNIIIVYEGSPTEEETADNYLHLPEGWSMFGYTCIDSVDAMVGFSEISDKIEIVKDEWGLSYLPSWEFNAMGSLQFSEGYQIKMIEEVTDFQFCEAIVPDDGISQADVDAAYLEGAASVTPEDGIGQSDVDSASQDGYNLGYADGSASVTPEDGITQANVDAAVAEVEASYAGYTAPLDLQIGDLHAGGIVFQINENGSGLVAAIEDLDGFYEWAQAVSQAPSYSSEGYTGWHLPTLDELELMYNTIGKGGPEGNIGGFEDDWYWSSSEYNNNLASSVLFYTGNSYDDPKDITYRVRVIRTF